MATNNAALATNAVYVKTLFGGPRGTMEDILISTDVGVDLEDAFCLWVLFALEAGGECNVLGLVTPLTNQFSAPATEVIARQWNRGDLLIGVPTNGFAAGDTDYFGSWLATNHVNALRSNTNAPSDVAVMRQILAARPDHSVTVVSIGQARNIANLFASGADKFSSLTGKQLYELKVKRTVTQGGDFPTGTAGGNYNWSTDAPAALVYNGMTNLTFIDNTFPLGVVLGDAVKNLPALHFLRQLQYQYAVATGGTFNRAAWDTLTLLNAVRGTNWNGVAYYNYTNGQITIAADGANTWSSSGTNQAHVGFLQSTSTYLSLINELLVRPPANLGPMIYGLHTNASAFKYHTVPLNSLRLAAGVEGSVATGLTYYNVWDGSGIPARANLSGFIQADRGDRDFTLACSLPWTVTQAVTTVTMYATANDSYTFSSWLSPYANTNAITYGATENQTITNQSGFYYEVKWTNNWTGYAATRPKIVAGYWGDNLTADAGGTRIVTDWTMAVKHSTNP